VVVNNALKTREQLENVRFMIYFDFRGAGWYHGASTRLMVGV